MDSLSPNAARILGSIFSILDTRSSSSLSHQVLIRELNVIVEHCLSEECPHLSAEQKAEVESQLKLYFESTQHDELITAIKDWPKRDQPLVRGCEFM